MPTYGKAFLSIGDQLKLLKFVLLDIIERVEIAVRVEIALQLGARNRFAHTNPNTFHPNFLRPRRRNAKTHYQIWTEKFGARFRNSTDEFTTHHKKRYGSKSPLPIWIAIELWDFGLLSNFFQGMRVADKRDVAASFLVSDWQLMETWLRSLNYIRNVIAHHGRLWNLNLSDRPSLPALGGIPEFDVLVPLHNVNSRIYSVCCILSHFSKAIDPKSDWPQKLTKLVEEFLQMPHAGIKDMGFPVDWRNHSFWT